MQGECDEHQYNFILRNEPYTYVLQKFFPKGRVPDGVQDAFEKIDLTYKMNEEVINVLIHYLHAARRSWSKASIEQAAADMLGRQIETFEQAVEFVREKMKLKQKLEAKEKTAAAGASGNGTSRGRGGAGKQKPQIPIVQDTAQGNRLSDEELEEIRRKAKQLDERFNKPNR
jgi:replication initiation and membrane attachment protein